MGAAAERWEGAKPLPGGSTSRREAPDRGGGSPPRSLWGIFDCPPLGGHDWVRPEAEGR